MNRDAPSIPDPYDGSADEPRDFEIEPWLRQLPLRSPSPELDERVAQVLRSAPSRERRRPLLLAAAAAIAIGVATVPLALQRLAHEPQRPVARVPGGTPAPPAPGPLRVEHQFARVSDNGVIGTANGVPVQLLRYRAVRQIWYFDPHTGKKLQVTVPRDQTFLVPVRTF